MPTPAARPRGFYPRGWHVGRFCRTGSKPDQPADPSERHLSPLLRGVLPSRSPTRSSIPALRRPSASVRRDPPVPNGQGSGDPASKPGPCPTTVEKGVVFAPRVPGRAESRVARSWRMSWRPFHAVGKPAFQAGPSSCVAPARMLVARYGNPTARDADNRYALGREGSAPPQDAGAPDKHGCLGSAVRGSDTRRSAALNPPHRRSATGRSGATAVAAPSATQRGRHSTRFERSLSSGALARSLRRLRLA
jgi:hypothetical protein